MVGVGRQIIQVGGMSKLLGGGGGTTPIPPVRKTLNCVIQQVVLIVFHAI